MISEAFVFSIPGLLAGHPGFTGIRAFTAGFSAFLAVVMIVFSALICAQAADLDTLFHHVLCMGRIPGYKTGGQGADIGAVTVEHDAADHHFYVVFLQTGSGAGFAGGDAFDQHMF